MKTNETSHISDSYNIKNVTSHKLYSSLMGLCSESPNDTIHINVVIYHSHPCRSYSLLFLFGFIPKLIHVFQGHIV